MSPRRTSAATNESPSAARRDLTAGVVEARMQRPPAPAPTAPVGAGRVRPGGGPRSGLSNDPVRSLLPDRARALVGAHAAPARVEAVHARGELPLLQRRQPDVLPAARGRDAR